ncbi:MAG: hypothetical protein HY290_06710 [Planctomycetia bacterium]|nr:hypothetical protein [Planctomycetia bacterium]
MALEFENETRILRGCFFDVQNEVGRGRSEEAYHHGCKLWFEERGLPVASKPPHPLLIRGQEAHRLFVAAAGDGRESKPNCEGSLSECRRR